MTARTHAELKAARRNIERIKKLSDNVVGIGPLGIGLDGLLSWVPGAGAVYSGIAGLMLIGEGMRVGAPAGDMFKIVLWIAADTFADILPLTPFTLPFLPATAVVDTFFTAHKWSANTLLRHMDNTIYIEGTREQARRKPEYADLVARVKSGREQRNVVFLGG